MKYNDVFEQSVNDPVAFWGDVAKGIDWVTACPDVLTETAEYYEWFPNGVLNTCYNAVDRHVENGRGDQAAIIFDSPVTGVKEKISYAELLEQVSLFAGALKKKGVEKGDTVIIYMPMIPQAAMAMLACARLGAIHSVVFGGFAPNELAIRIDHAQPKLIVTASGAREGKKVLAYKPLVDEALSISTHQVDAVIIFERDFIKAECNNDHDYYWGDLIAHVTPAKCVPVAATDPLYILYTSGTTGMPKGVMRDNGGHAVALNWSMKNIYNIEAGDVFWSASDVGWVVGHSYIVYGPLLAGATTVFYEGKPIGTPDAGAFWRVISEHNVKVMFTAPTAFRAIKKEDPDGALLKTYDLTCFEALYLAGERLDSDTYHWASALLNVPVIDHWWQTETGWAIVGNCRGIEEFPIKAGSPTKPCPGYDVQILDDNGKQLGANEEGNVVVKLPLPPGTLSSLWRDPEKFQKAYLRNFPGYYETSDGGYIDEDGYVFIMGRMDDVINIAGHRLSTGAMEEIVATHPDVAECAVVGTADQLKGQLPVGLVVLKSGCERNEAEMSQELAKMVREKIGPIACYKISAIVPRLPKTRSGKILRGTMRSIANGTDFRMPSTIDDPQVLDEISDVFGRMGFAVKDNS